MPRKADSKSPARWTCSSQCRDEGSLFEGSLFLTAFSRPITREKMATMANSAPASPTAHDSVLRAETGDLGPSKTKAPRRVRWYKHTVWLWLPLIRALRNDAARAITLRQPFFSLSVGAPTDLLLPCLRLPRVVGDGNELWTLLLIMSAHALVNLPFAATQRP